ncbi:MAG: alpha/beta fold hydrolase [Alphaproteobacteria bacterium]|nr:alpha/beta fold hydrolase [Alphaproteobacteria bacterium]
MSVQSPDSIELAYQRYGDGGPPIIVLHGLLGSGRNWATIAKRLAASHKVETLDLRNHGASPWADAMTYALMAADVRSHIERTALGPVTLIGHSMGGKTAMRLALDAPSLVERLVVVDIAPVGYDHSTGEYVEALRALDLGGLASRNEVDERLAAIVPDPAIRAFLLQNLARGDEGFSWRANLDALSKAMADLMSFATGEHDLYRGPALFLAGANSHYVRSEHRPTIDQLFAKADIRAIADAGHWVHAEQPAAFLAHLQDFLGR